MSNDLAAALTIEKAHVDLRSTKTQMLLGVLLMLAAVVAARWSLLGAGFTDSLDGDIVSMAQKSVAGSQSDAARLLQYSPLAGGLLIVEAFAWQDAPLPYHVVSLIVIMSCCVLVGLITMEITGLQGNRLGASAAVWAGLLFAVHPLHSQVDMAVVANVEMLGALMYLAALWAYLRYHLLREPLYLWTSVACFLLGLLSDLKSITLPLALLGAAFLLGSRRTAVAREGARPFRMALPHLVLLGLFCLGAPLLGDSRLATGAAELAEHVSSDWLASLVGPLSILFPTSSEAAPDNWIGVLGTCGYVACFTILLIRLWKQSAPAVPIAWSIFLLGVTCAPVALIWTNSSAAERFFGLYPAAAFVCVLLSLSALPALDAVNRRTAAILALCGVVALCVLFAAWSMAFLAEARVVS
ncbi:MAG TPA: hypothetical protein V6D08_07905 [Candidatus Obscuribacterales bacterium]